MQTWTFGPAGIYTATWDGTSKVTVTLTAGGAFVASFYAGSLAQAIASPEYQAILSPAPSAITGLSLVATTGVNGFTLVNGTPNILSWTAPNDGAMHRVMLISELAVSSVETGGKVGATFTDPGSGARNQQLYAAALAAGIYGLPGNNSPVLTLVAPNTAYVLQQQNALTAGAAVLYAELWAS